MDTHVIRLHFKDGTSALSGTLTGRTADRIDASMARDINGGWALGVGCQAPDGRIVERVTSERDPELGIASEAA